METGHSDDINADDVTPSNTESAEMHGVDSQDTTTKQAPSKSAEGTHRRFHLLLTCTESLRVSATVS